MSPSIRIQKYIFLNGGFFFFEFHCLPSVFRPDGVFGNQNLTVSKSGDLWKRFLLTCVWTGENGRFWTRWWHWVCSRRDASLFICGLSTAIQPTLPQYIKVRKNWRLLPDEFTIHTRDRFGWGGKRNKIYIIRKRSHGVESGKDKVQSHNNNLCVFSGE